ncbi:hypothetical protein PO909_013248 [Leuciscus waleckii]
MHVEKEAVSSDEGQAERVYANSKESEIVQELDETGRIEQKDGNNEECDQKYEDEKCSKKREDPDSADVTFQSELYVEQEKEMNMMDHGVTESIGGLKHEDFIDEMEKKTVGLKDRMETEIDEDQGPELQVPADAFVLAVQDLPPELEYSAEEGDGLSKPERLKVLEKYYDEIAEFCKNEVEEMIPENRGASESEQDTFKSELQESAETLQRVSKEKHRLNIETELKMTSVLDEFFETVNTSEDSLQLDSKQDTPENTSETGTGLPVVAIKTEGMFSNPIVCEFPGEWRKMPETAVGCFEEIKTEPQSLAEEQTGKKTFIARFVEHPDTPKAVEEAVEIEQDIETPIESLSATESQTHQEIDDTTVSLRKHVELKTELIVETTEIKISSEDEEAEPFETQSQSSNIRNITSQTHELLEFTEGESKSSQETMDTFSESLGNSSVSEITGTAEIHVAEDQTDAKPVLTRTLSPAHLAHLQGESEQCIEEQETLDTDVAKIALQYVEEITNQVLKEMTEMEMNLVKETLEGLSTEELGDAEYQGPEECMSVGAFVLEEEGKLLGETIGSIMEVEPTCREVAKQNEQDIISQECETTEADQQTYLCAGKDHGGSSSCDTESDTHVDNEAVSSNEGQTEKVHANSECKESETELELDKTGQIEQKDDNDEECDQNHEDEKCEMKSEDPDNAEIIVQSELYGQDVEQGKQMNMMDHGETESSGGFRHAAEHLVDEKEKNIVDQNDHEKTEIDEDQGTELQVPADAFVLEEGRKLLGETMEVENTSSDVVKQIEQQSSPECETTEADQQTYLCAGTDHGGSSSCDTESDTHVENEAVSSNEGQTERVHANSECKESETELELDKTGQIEQKDVNDEECDQNNEDEKCEMKSEDPDNAEVIVQSELYGQDVEQEKQMNMMDHGETESSGGFRHAAEHLVDEKEKNIVDQNDHEKTEIDEDQGPELQVPADAFVLEEGRKLLGETMEVENTSSDVVKQIELQSSPECETTEADQQTYLCAGTDHGGSSSCDTESDTHVENEAVSSNEGQTERVHANSECKESETALELDKTGQIEQKDDNDEECDQNHEDEKCEMKSEDPDNAEQEKQMNMMDHGETESSGGFRHAAEHLVDEKEKNIVDQNDHEKTEIDEDQGPELQVPADAFVLEEGRKLLGETMEVENASDVVKQIELQSSTECETNEADGRHDQIQKAIAGETESSGHEDFMEISRPGMKRGFDSVSKDLPVVKIKGTFDLYLQAFEDSSLDFTVQKSRIAVKNPLVRPPKDPRKLLYKISVEPLLPKPPPSEVSVPSKGGVGFKLPGLGAGLPALRKTEFGKQVREGEAERTLHPQQKAVAVTEDSVKQEQASAKPKWTPPKLPGMGSPLMMAELKNKLKKPTKE